MSSVGGITQSDRAPEHAVELEVRRVDDVFDFVALVLGTHSQAWLKDFGKEFNLGSRPILFVKEQV